MKKIIEKNRLEASLEPYLKEYKLYGPKEKDGTTGFFPLASFDEIIWDKNPQQTTKTLFFPQTEKLLTYKKGKQAEIKQSSLELEKRIVLAVRPCDLKAVSLLDKVFLSKDFVDPYYAQRRQNTILIGLGCSQICHNCFCSAVGIDPVSSAVPSIFLLDIGGKFLATDNDNIGKEMIKSLADASLEDLAKAEEITEQVRKQLTPILFTAKSKEEIFEHPYWDKVHQKCVSCGICTYLCPTCHCFDIQEEIKDPLLTAEGERVRTWDSCMFPSFTLHTSGHNPRADKKARLRQRFLHKFSYFLDSYGEIACVGCGRCVVNCPVNLDTREVLKTLENIEG